ncbi:MAG: SRPBCC family protein [Paracoccaceae bacterium]|nr:SRPBCC family protein [Paracoccaceae bacterium]
MTTTVNAYGTLTDPSTLKMERLLPGPVERIWAFLTESDLRRLWLASGPMDLTPGGVVDLTWRNDELTDPPGTRPDGMKAENHMLGHVIAVDAPHMLCYDWPNVGEVTFELTQRGAEVLLTLTHRRVPNRSTLLGVSGGWHSHLDLLEACARNTKPAPHWDNFRRLRAEYEQRLGA